MYHAPRKVAICQCHCVYRKHQYHIALVVAKSCNTWEKVRIIVVWHYTGERKWKDWLVLLPIVGVVATRYFFFVCFFVCSCSVGFVLLRQVKDERILDDCIVYESILCDCYGYVCCELWPRTWILLLGACMCEWFWCVTMEKKDSKCNNWMREPALMRTICVKRNGGEWLLCVYYATNGDVNGIVWNVCERFPFSIK